MLTGIFVGIVEHLMKATIVTPVHKSTLFLLDSGASCHVIGDETWLTYPSVSKELVKIGDGTIMCATNQRTQYL